MNTTTKKLCNCSLCKKVMFLKNNSNKIKTTTLCVLILKALKEIKPEKEFYSMRQDIYDFVSEHWSCVKGFSIFSKPNWKKMLLDTFNHCTHIETGRNYGLRASFRIKIKGEESKSENENAQNVKTECETFSPLQQSKELVVNQMETVANTPVPVVENYEENNGMIAVNYYQQLSQLRLMMYNNISLMKQCQGVAYNNVEIPNWMAHCMSMSNHVSTLSFIIDNMFSCHC